MSSNMEYVPLWYSIEKSLNTVIRDIISEASSRRYIIVKDYGDDMPLLIPNHSVFTTCDVLFGWGGPSNRHIDNKRYREEDDLVKHKYNKLIKKYNTDK